MQRHHSLKVVKAVVGLLAAYHAPHEACIPGRLDARGQGAALLDFEVCFPVQVCRLHVAVVGVGQQKGAVRCVNLDH